MIRIAIVGAGNRGTSYTGILALMQDKCQVTAIADPIESRLNKLAQMSGNPEVKKFGHWQDILDYPGKIADAVIIATQDREHTAPALAFAKAGYHMILEKPMASTLEECETIVAAVKEANICFAVCHVLRYTPYFRKFKELITSGEIGEVVSIQHLESVVYWHYAHGFVRGNWRNSKMSSSMLLQKSCHDLDILSFLIDRKCVNVSSFGSLRFFRNENHPVGAADRCLDCPSAIADKCPYSAVKIYWHDRAEKGKWDWPVDVVSEIPTRDALFDRLRNGPYGRCVFSCDNDVVDHQVVNLEFDGGVTANFTTTAFTPLDNPRKTMAFGTQGMIEGDGKNLTVYRYLDDSNYTIDTGVGQSTTIADGHGGGDTGLITTFFEAIIAENWGVLTSGPDISLESHRLVFKSEESRLNVKTIPMPSTRIIQ